jgi:hypothetical protein
MWQARANITAVEAMVGSATVATTGCVAVEVSADMSEERCQW